MNNRIRYDGAALRAYRRHRADGATRAEARALLERGAYTCGTCGRRWAWETPAGRCPWEVDCAPPPPLSYRDLGAIVLAEAGEAACLSGYGTTDPALVGRSALAYGDINRDGTLN